MPGMTTTRLSYTDYLSITWTRNSKWQREWKNSNSKLYYFIPEQKFRQYEVKLSRLCNEYTTLNHRYLVFRNV